MSMPFYVSPEQVMADKAEFARKGISRGKSIVALEFADGVLLIAENATSLSKVGEIYDRIAFAGHFEDGLMLRAAAIVDDDDPFAPGFKQRRNDPREASRRFIRRDQRRYGRGRPGHFAVLPANTNDYGAAMVMELDYRFFRGGAQRRHRRNRTASTGTG